MREGDTSGGCTYRLQESDETAKLGGLRGMGFRVNVGVLASPFPLPERTRMPRLSRAAVLAAAVSLVVSGCAETPIAPAPTTDARRSEERRVGKECRSR